MKRQRAPFASVAALFAASLAAVPSRGAAAATTVALEYEVAPEVRGCPDADVFRANVRQQLGRDPFVPASERHAGVLIARTPAGFFGRIRWSDAAGHETGERRLSSRRPDCAAIASDLVFAVVVQLQLLDSLGPSAAIANATPAAATQALPDSGATTKRVSPAPLSSGAPAASPPPRTELARRDDGSKTIAARASSAAPALPSPITLSAGLGPSLALGLAPRPTALGRVVVSARRRQLSLELALDASWPVTRSGGDGAGFVLERTAVETAACGHVDVLSACLTGTAGALRARGQGVDAPTSATGIFYQVGARLGARLDLGHRLFAAAHADGLWLLSPWTVTVDGAAVWVTPRVGALLGVDFAAIFF